MTDKPLALGFWAELEFRCVALAGKQQYVDKNLGSKLANRKLTTA